MTRKLESKRSARRQERPTLARERLKDLSADAVADQIRGGLRNPGESGGNFCSYGMSQDRESCGGN